LTLTFRFKENTRWDSKPTGSGNVRQKGERQCIATNTETSGALSECSLKWKAEFNYTRSEIGVPAEAKQK